MEIKTLIANTDNVVAFDKKVNEAMAEGWRLAKREILPGQQYNETNWARRILYAELVKLDPPAEPETPDLLKAVQVIKAECDSHGSCEDCLVYPWCDYNAPCRWKLPEEVQDDGE